MPGTRERWRMSVEARALVLVTAVLTTFGLAVLYSASAIVAVNAGSAGHHYLVRQGLGVVAGAVIFALLAKLDAERWRRWAWPIMGVSILMMLVVVLPGTESITGKYYGSRRYLFSGSIQPSEFAKFAILVWTPMLLVKKGDTVKRFGKGLMPFAVIVGVLSLLAVLEPDYSVAMMFCLLMAVLLLVGGARLSHFVMVAVLATLALGYPLSQTRYIQNRLDKFMTKSETVTDTHDQQYQSLMAVGSGGVVGVGFGQGNQQRGWLPLAYNDFIGSVVGEEFGFLGLAGITVAFAIYGWLGFRIARQARSPFCALLAVGLTFTTVFTAFVHLGVVIELLPNTGLTLPFVSYGRSNLVLTFAMTGILVNIGSERERVFGERATDPMLAPAG
jgi:cell division protein FtsW